MADSEQVDDVGTDDVPTVSTEPTLNSNQSNDIENTSEETPDQPTEAPEEVTNDDGTPEESLSAEQNEDSSVAENSNVSNNDEITENEATAAAASDDLKTEDEPAVGANETTDDQTNMEEESKSLKDDENINALNNGETAAEPDSEAVGDEQAAENKQSEDISPSDDKPLSPASKQTSPTTPRSVPVTPKGTPPAPPRTPEEAMLPSAPSQPSTQQESRPETVAGPNALNMVWTFGMNIHIPLLNMTDGYRKMIMYASAHTGVLYDMENNSQTLLQGHSNPISFTCVSEDKRWLATADRGTDSILIIWDSQTGMPVRTMFSPAPDGGVIAMAITNDAKYLATLSAAENEQMVQTLAIWDWTNGEESPMYSTQIDPQYGIQTYILFNPENSAQLVSNNDSQVIFYSYENGSLDYYAPSLSDKDFNKPVGKYSQSVFQQHGTRAMTATNIGNLVVWENNKPNHHSSPDKKALKLVKIQEKAINVLTTTDKFLVAGDALGHVKYFDQTLKLVNWYQDFRVGPITSISFAYIPEFDLVLKREDTEYPPDATIAAKQFFIRDFVVGSSTAIYAHITTDGTVVDVIHRDHDGAVHALATHPSKPHVAVGGYSGLLKIWDYKKRQVVVSRYFDRGNFIRCCVFDHKGEFLAVGFTNGSVRILDALTLDDDMKAFHYSRDAVTKVVFSNDSKYLATADAEFTVTVYERATDPDEADSWLYLGRNRSHYKTIRDVMFGVQLDNDKPRLMSLGEDRLLVEYSLDDSSKDDIRVLASDRIEQSSVPYCMTWYPPITKEQFICTANDQFKLKMYNSTTKMCRKTLLGPTYGSPLERILILPTADEIKDDRYMIYITHDKVGLHILPLDGNPHNSMALIAHPNGVSNLACSHDGRFVFTAGGSDATVHMWDINVEVLKAQSRLGGPHLIPFYGLLDGGREGELFAELEDYFYYAQLRSQGVDTTDTRKVSTRIALSEVPFVMRAMGYYPSEQEVQDMINEVKYSRYVESGKYVDDIDLGEFIRLYVNHRPAFGLSAEKLLLSFEKLGIPSDGGLSAVDRGDLLDMLQSRGEHMTEYELAEYLTTLLGFNPEGGASELQDFDASSAGEILDEFLPHEVNAELFASEILGLSLKTTDILNVVAEQQMC